MASEVNLKKLSSIQLLRNHFGIMEELKKQGVIRTRNNPISGYAEWLVSKKLNLLLTGNSTQGVDAIDKKGKRYQVKARHLVSPSSSRQLGVIRNLGKKQFDVLLVVMFDRNFNIENAYLVPHKIIGRYARYSKHQNGHILIIKGGILTDRWIKEISSLLR